MRMVSAYSMFDNGGRRIVPTFIDRIQDRYGRTVYKHDSLECRGCNAKQWANQPEPTLIDKREQVIDPMTAYQITSMMEGVVQRGTATVLQAGRQADRRQDRHHQRREGRLVRRLLARPRGRRLSRLRQAAPARQPARPAAASPRRSSARFLKEALKDKPAVPFRVPAGIKLIRIDARSGMRQAGGEGRAILEAFKPGTAPPDSYSVIGYTPDAGNNPGQGSGPPGGEPGYIAAAAEPADPPRRPAGSTDAEIARGYFSFSQVMVRTLIRPLTGSGVGRVDRCTRSPSNRAIRTMLRAGPAPRSRKCRRGA